MRGVGVDIIGDIAVIEIPKGTNRKKAVEGILENKHVKVVLQKASERKGKLRLYKLKHLAGEKRTKTIHTESGVRFYVDVAKVYFSPRLSGERLRVAQQVRPNESVLVMFSGAGPYVYVIARMQPDIKEIYGIEINKFGTKNSVESLKLNKKLKDVHFINGDAGKAVLKLKKKFDRIVMPAPHSAEKFLDVALKSIKKGGIIHYYDFCALEEFPQKIVDKITKACIKNKKKIKILNSIKCGQHSPGKYRVCVEFRVI